MPVRDRSDLARIETCSDMDGLMGVGGSSRNGRESSDNTVPAVRCHRKPGQGHGFARKKNADGQLWVSLELWKQILLAEHP